MGLDITVYQKIKKASEKKIKEDAYDFEAFVISDCWKDRVKNLEYGQFYVGKSVGSHSTGYGSHRFFRDNLCDVVGIPKTWTEIDGDKTKPFYELINFADNEGCLDWEVSENLYDDFVNNREKALKVFGEDNMYNYDAWTEVFRLGKDKGVVVFH